MRLPRARKSLGQHYLVDRRVMGRIVDRAGITSEDVVLEIGPGPGVMTRMLCAQAREVVAIELDSDLAAALAAESPANLRIEEADAVDAPWPVFDVMCSNLPYNVSTPILLRLLKQPGWRSAVVLVQREFAERLAAGSGSKTYGRLSIAAAFRARVEILERVPPGAFHPPPRVESSVIRLTPRAPDFPVEDERLYFELVQAAFTNRRKKLANGISVGAHLVNAPSTALREALKDVPFKDARPEELSPAMFAEVANHVAERLGGVRSRDREIDEAAGG